MTNEAVNDFITDRITKVPFHVSHVDLMHMREHEMFNLSDAQITNLANAGNGYTYMYSGRILCIAGHIKVQEGVADVYIIPSIYIPVYAKHFHKAVKVRLDELSQKFKRLQTASWANSQTDKWMTALGFRWEGTLRNYAPDGSDYNMWGRVK